LEFGGAMLDGIDGTIHFKHAGRYPSVLTKPKFPRLFQSSRLAETWSFHSALPSRTGESSDRVPVKADVLPYGRHDDGGNDSEI